MKRKLPCKCNGKTKVVDTNLIKGGTERKRRVECQECGKRFTTIEKIVSGKEWVE